MSTFSKELKAGDFYAVKVDLDERRLEGDYWVVRLTEAMKQAEDEYLRAGEVIRKGRLVVKGQWLQTPSRVTTDRRRWLGATSSSMVTAS